MIIMWSIKCESILLDTTDKVHNEKQANQIWRMGCEPVLYMLKRGINMFIINFLVIITSIILVDTPHKETVSLRSYFIIRYIY